MALEITITLRIDYDTANKKIKEPLITAKAREYAKELLTFAQLTADSRKPQISLQAGDLWSDTADIELVQTGDE